MFTGCASILQGSLCLLLDMLIPLKGILRTTSSQKNHLNQIYYFFAIVYDLSYPRIPFLFQVLACIPTPLNYSRETAISSHKGLPRTLHGYCPAQSSHYVSLQAILSMLYRSSN